MGDLVLERSATMTLAVGRERLPALFPPTPAAAERTLEFAAWCGIAGRQVVLYGLSWRVAAPGRTRWRRCCLRVHLMQSWFALSDPAMEEALSLS